MKRIEPFDEQKLETACRVIADTEHGLTESEIGYLLQDCKLTDISPTMEKWRRLFVALLHAQDRYKVGNHLIMFINRALDPTKYAGDKDNFNWRKNELNVVLSFTEFSIREDGKVIHAKKATTSTGAQIRAEALRSKLEDRGSHHEIYKYCKAELLEEHYFHAVTASIKNVASRIRELSDLTSDGAELVNKAFSVKEPILVINSLSTEAELCEQKGFRNILIGLFGALKNSTNVASKITWPISEQDALDIFSMISFIHRKLEITIKINGSY